MDVRWLEGTETLAFIADHILGDPKRCLGAKVVDGARDLGAFFK